MIGVVPSAVAEMLDLENGFRALDLDLDLASEEISVEPYGIITNAELTKSPAALHVLERIEKSISPL